MKNFEPILRSIGLLESEIKTYLSALENGPGTVLELAKLTKLSRQAMYTAIESLIQRGLMTSVLHEKKRYYAADHPQKLLDFARRRETQMKEHIHELAQSLPELELRVGGEKPVVKVYEGKEGVRAIIADMKIAKPRSSQEITDLEAMYKVLTVNDLAPMRNEMKRLGIHVEGLYAGEPSKKIASSERHILPKDLSDFKANITIYNDKIALVTFEGKMHSVLIESKALAKTLRILFGLAFTSGKQLPQK